MAAVESPFTNGSSRANGALNGNGDVHEPVSSEPAIPFDPSVFHSYLTSLLPPILGASPEELESIFDDEFEERVLRFVGEGGGVVYVVKKKDEQECTSAISRAAIRLTDTRSSRGRTPYLLLQANTEPHL